MSYTEIVIAQPFGTTLATVLVPGGVGQLDTNIGADVVEAGGFGINGAGIAYFQVGGANPGEEAKLGLSEAGLVTVTAATAGGTLGLIEEGVHAPIPKPPRPLSRLARRLRRKRNG